MTSHWILDLAIAGLLAAAIVLVIRCNIEYWSQRRRMTPTERRRDDEEYRQD